MKKINQNEFKKIMSRFATGVTIISLKNNKKLIGKTVNSFSSLSLKPPMILFALDKQSSSLKEFKNAKYLGVSFLSKEQKKISLHFSKKNVKWGDIEFYISKNDIPLLKNCLVNLECELVKKYQGGDHLIFICKILTSSYSNNKKPMIYYKNKYI